jgi:hypothetical protein
MERSCCFSLFVLLEGTVAATAFSRPCHCPLDARLIVSQRQTTPACSVVVRLHTNAARACAHHVHTVAASPRAGPQSADRRSLSVSSTTPCHLASMMPTRASGRTPSTQEPGVRSSSLAMAWRDYVMPSRTMGRASREECGDLGALRQPEALASTHGAHLVRRLKRDAHPESVLSWGLCGSDGRPCGREGLPAGSREVLRVDYEHTIVYNGT